MTELSTNFTCQSCGHDGLVEVASFPELPRITSDCRPFPAGGRLSTCSNCGAAQKFLDQRWQKEIAEIYANYASYSQAGGVEQVVIDSASGQLKRRSEVIVARIQGVVDLPAQGAMLDVGCGGGATLRVMSEARPRWELYGAEIGTEGHEHLKTIPNFSELYTCPPSRFPPAFRQILC